MKLSEVNVLELLPEWMQDDTSIRALALGTNEEARDTFLQSGLLSRWNRIDELPEEYLDGLAKELNIPWYSTSAELETKRAVIKNSDLVHKLLGTKEAVEMVINDYFGSGEVREWFEYDGKPYHFRVVSDEPERLADNAELFLHLLNSIKRKSAWLDALAVLIEEQSGVYAGAVYHDIEKLTINFQLEGEEA